MEASTTTTVIFLFSYLVGLRYIFMCDVVKKKVAWWRETSQVFLSFFSTPVIAKGNVFSTGVCKILACCQIVFTMPYIKEISP